MSEDTPAVVETTSGKIEGIFRRGLYAFRGVPYAAPPVGRLRWLPPEPPEPWSEVRPALRLASIAPQNLMGLQLLESPVPEPQDEDCLYLNVWTPGLDDARRPVMVWIHGGGFTSGSGSSLAYNGRTLSTGGDTVIVTINYRLNVLGFLNLNEVTGGKIPATGNEGLLDQAFALEWVHDNITNFGGDPDNVTIFGESAGGFSVGSLLALPKARGLFHKAILQSGAAHSAYSNIDAARHVASTFLELLGISPNDSDGLRSLNVEHLLKGQRELAGKALDPESGLGGLTLRPVVDGKILPHLPIDAVTSGSADNIPIIVGTNLDEAKLFSAMNEAVSEMDESRLLSRYQQLITGEDVPGLIESYRKARQRRGMSTTPAEIFMALQTDKGFRIPAIRLAERHSRRSQPAYMYLFTWVSPMRDGILGACHALELGFVFGTRTEDFSGSGPEADALERNIQDAWLAFARTGDPSCDGLGKWPLYNERRETMLLGEECTVVAAPYDEERRAWEAIPDTVLGVL
ncbi:MAG: carboxylesterase/lipase family protein [Dehalococcoidales bacterium]|nr:MAG: carboxylesterase/lipase family protein [Dehalococcoidales bacterium]